MFEPNKTYSEYTTEEIEIGYHFMIIELAEADAPNWLCEVFKRAWLSFEQGDFAYDGATFSIQRSKKTVFEIGAFLHDWLNSMGIVSYQADDFMLYVMKMLGYRWNLRVGRYLKTRLTFLNIWRHKNKGTYIGKFPIEIIFK